MQYEKCSTCLGTGRYIDGLSEGERCSDCDGTGRHMDVNPYPTPEKRFYVCRKYSHTDRRQLWSVESRPFVNQPAAAAWKEYLEDESPKLKGTFFIVQMQPEDIE